MTQQIDLVSDENKNEEDREMIENSRKLFSRRFERIDYNRNDEDGTSAKPKLRDPKHSKHKIPFLFLSEKTNILAKGGIQETQQIQLQI